MKDVKSRFMISLNHVDSILIDNGIRESIKKIIKEKSMSVRKLSEKTEGDISYGFLNKLIYGQRDSISKEKFFHLCNALGVNPENLLDCSINYFNQKD